MQSNFKTFKGTNGMEEVLIRANEFINRVGREQLIGINTLIDPSEVQVAGIASRMSRGAYAESVVVVVWYWETT